MTEIEKIQRYIERTKLDKNRMSLGFVEACALTRAATTPDDTLEMIALAFNYGKAKGYRAAKAERRAAE